MNKWESVKLGEVVSIKTGKLDANEAVENGDYPFFTCAKEISRIDNYAFDGESVLVAGNGDLNVKYYNGKFNAYQRTYVLQILNTNLNVKYLYYFLEEHLEKLRAKSIGGVIKYIKLGNLQELKIPLPPLSIQQEIAERLDKMATLVEKSKAQLNHYDALAESLFIELFGDPITNEKGWQKKKLGEVCELQNGYAFSSNDYSEEGIPLIRISNIQDGIADIFDTIYVKNIVDDKYIVKKGDLLIAMSGATTGKMGIYISNEEAFLNQRVGNIRIINEFILSPKYRNYFMMTKKDEILKMAHGAAQPNISSKKIGSIIIPLPPLSLQQAFAEMVENIEEQKTKIRAEIEQAEQGFQALLQESF